MYTGMKALRERGGEISVPCPENTKVRFNSAAGECGPEAENVTFSSA